MRDHLSERFHIDATVREIGPGRGYRLLQIQKSGNRHLVDVRSADSLPSSRVAGVLVLAPAELIASKVRSFYRRRAQPKSFTDRRDIAELLLQFPELKQSSGRVTDALRGTGAVPKILAAWQQLVAEEIQPSNEDDDF